MAKQDDDGSAVPNGRLQRLGRLGRFTAGAAGEALGNGVKALSRGQALDARTLILTPSNAQRLTRELAELRGAAMKMGQMLSMDTGDVLPAELTQILSRLREQAQPMPPRQLKRVLTRNWGADWMRRVSKFTVKPIAAASIGQVHKATTRDGRTLAVKIQYPGVRDSIDADVDNLSRLIALSGLAPKGLDLSEMFVEIKRQLKDEADYQREAQMLARFKAHLKDNQAFILPETDLDLTTSDILAMSFVPGDPIETAIDALPSERERIMKSLIHLFLREIFEFGVVQSDPNFANYRYLAETAQIGLLDFGAAQTLPPEVVEGVRCLLRSGLHADRDGYAQALETLGYLGDDTPHDQRALVLDLTELALAPIFSKDAFRFEAGDLIAPLRDGGFALRDMGYTRTPAPMAVFLQRKIAGLYLLGQRLDTQINLRAMIEPWTI